MTKHNLNVIFNNKKENKSLKKITFLMSVWKGDSLQKILVINIYKFICRVIVVTTKREKKDLKKTKKIVKTKNRENK